MKFETVIIAILSIALGIVSALYVTLDTSSKDAELKRAEICSEAQMKCESLEWLCSTARADPLDLKTQSKGVTFLRIGACQ